MNRRSWYGLLIGLIAIVYALVAIEAARSEFLLVDDYLSFAMSRIGEWPAGIAASLADFSSPGAWLYRPFRDAMSWLFSTIFRNRPGVWHLVLLALRLASVALAFGIARRSASSAVAVVAGAAYFAFFPAIPELGLFRAESYLMPALAAAFLGWLRLSRGEDAVAWTAIAFVLATMSKEIMAPLLAVLFLLLAPLFWRRGNGARLALLLMFAALLNQSVRCAMAMSDPYAQGSGSLVARAAANAFWTAKVLLLAATSFAPLSLILLALFVLGGLSILRQIRAAQTHFFAAGIVLMVLAATGLTIAGAYPAIRYIYPIALFLVPVLALGVDELRRIAGDRLAAATACGAVVLLAIFGGANLWAQAAAMRASTRADWQLLNHVANAFARGEDVTVIDDPDFERAFWIRGELVGVDPRWPFLSYVAQQYAADKRVIWPRPAGAINLTGRVPAEPRARFLLISQKSDFSAVRGMLIPANPFTEVERLPRGVTVAQRIDYRHDDFSFTPLSAFARLAHYVNPRFHYAVDLGHSPYPGHYWVILSSSRRISRAGLPPTSVNGGTSRVTTDAAATTAPLPR